MKKKSGKKNISLTLTISSLQAGGAERVMANMANYWAKRGWDITILAMCEKDVPVEYALDDRVRYVPIGVLKSSGKVTSTFREIFRLSNITRFWTLRKALLKTKPDIVVSFLNKINISVLIALVFSKIPVIVSERADPYLYRIGIFWDIIRRLVYLFADAIVFQTVHAKSYFFPQSWYRSRVIPNSLKIEKKSKIGKFPLKHPNVVSLGRFTFEKGHDVLIRSFARFLQKKNNDSILYLFGTGPLLDQLKRVCEEVGLEKKVIFPGIATDPFSIFRETDIFVLPSRQEGFPNALCEAMAMGVPVIATKTAGAESIIFHRENGILVEVEKEEAIENALIDLYRDKRLRIRLSKNAKKIVQTLDESKIMTEWENVIFLLQK